MPEPVEDAAGPVRYATVGRPTDGGWHAVDDAGRPLQIGRADVTVRDLHAGQRVVIDADGVRIP
ncbi:hypothetical protein [Nigerium massiliense]|uniref:hypothetical protein n=1 Tax=Nigerium massiliense TaxID=1522317 RepID=UPI00058AFB25|nr:hypothetical protein [Nigerium massiliense]